MSSQDQPLTLPLQHAGTLYQKSRAWQTAEVRPARDCEQVRAISFQVAQSAERQRSVASAMPSPPVVVDRSCSTVISGAGGRKLLIESNRRGTHKEALLAVYAVTVLQPARPAQCSAGSEL